MRHAILALVWEQWRQTWRPLLLGAMAIGLYLGWVAVLPDGVRRFYYDEDAAIAAAWLMTLSTLMFLFVHGSLRQFQIAFPRRLLTLPVRTEWLVLTHLLYRLAVAAVFAMGVDWGTRQVFAVEMPSWVQLLVVVSGVAWAQALVCLGTSFGFLRSGVLAAGLFLLSSLAQWFIADYLADLRHVGLNRSAILFLAYLLLLALFHRILSRLIPRLWEGFAALVLILGWSALSPTDVFGDDVLWRDTDSRTAFVRVLVFLLAGYALVIPWMLANAAAAYARGHAPRYPRMPRLRGSGWLKAFLETPLGTQCWYEWRNAVAWLPRLMFITLLFWLAGGILASMAPGARWGVGNALYVSILLQLLVLLPFMAPVLAFGVGYRLLRWTPNDLAFCATRPLSTGLLTRAKLLAGAVASVCTGILVLVGVLLLIVLADQYVLNRWSTHVIWEWKLMLPAAILCMWGSLFVGRLCMLTAGLASCVLIPLTWFRVLPRIRMEDDLVLGCVLGVIALSIIAAVGVLRAKGVLKPNRFSLGLLLVATLLLAAMPVHRLYFKWALSAEDFNLGLCAAALVLAPVVWTPITVQWNRHR